MSEIISKDKFKELVTESREPVYVDFYADWCGPCKMLSPIMDELSDSYKVYKVNVDSDEELAREYGVMSIPCVILFKNGKESKRSVGLTSLDNLLKMNK